MEEKKVIECHCENCGNEANMTVTCKLVDVVEPSGAKVKKQLETRVCTECGNEANMIIDFGK
ncbi:MAG: hypothetical protein FJ139_10865 [Deltaproteobacteria bacterium]|nr:hypothetical protein [Deltaproteobacteria bacterium]